jgi:hypothetical protein
LEVFDQYMMRLYNKGPVVRSEVVISDGVVTLDQALLLMQRGLLEFGWLREIRDRTERLEAMMTAERAPPPKAPLPQDVRTRFPGITQHLRGSKRWMVGAARGLAKRESPTSGRT